MMPAGPINLLFLNWMAELGGAEIALLRILCHLDRKRFVPHLWLFQEGPLADRCRSLGIKVTVQRMPRFRFAILNPFFHLKLYRYLRQHPIQCVIGMGALGMLLGFPASRWQRKPLIWWMMDIPDGSDFNINFACRLKTDLFLGCSKAVCDGFQHVSPKNQTPCKALYLPVEDNGHSVSLENLRQELEISEDAPVISLFGRLQRWKGQKTLIESIPEIRREIPEAVFLIAGGTLPGMEDGYEKELKQTADRLHIAGQCRFLGQRTDVKQLMALSDIVVHTSVKPEPFGLVVAEAMALGKAVVAANQGGPAEMIQHGKNGLLIEPQNPAVLAQAILQLLKDTSLWKELGVNARITARNQFLAPVITKSFEQITEGLAAV